MNPAPALPGANDGLLADAFSVFVSAAARLERSYAQLHDEVAQLRAQLEERNRALASSLKENARMKIVHSQILDALPCGVAVVDAQNEEIVLVNPEGARLLGMPSSEKPQWTRLPSSLRAMIASGPSQSWRLGDEQQIVVHAAWGDCWLRVRCTSVESAGGQGGGSTLPTLVLTIRDTTFQKQADEEREASRQMMALAEMATLLAHEIRNPLGSMELFASLLASDEALNDQSKKWAEHLQAGVRTLSATVNNVLRFHTPGTAQLVATNLRDLLVNGLEFIRPLAQQAGVGLSFEETLGESQVMAEAGALQQLLLNLAHNAFRHTATGGVFSVRASVESHRDTRVAVVEFSDTGSGISPEDLPHIFDAGFSTARQSTGLGLAVCQRIMAQHRGTISATSKLGEGTTFRVELPIL
ncbi:MAG TPA: ATP-binding protein [Terriglobales bacterium]|nr:ATP-binding protein [Terriglobales bacterium]